MIDRIKNLITTPKREWLVISTEVTTPQKILIQYVLPLALFSALGKVISGMVPAGILGMDLIWGPIIGFVSIFIAFFISIYVIDALAPGFKSVRNLNRSAQLVAYSNTPVWLAGFFSFIPVIGNLLAIAAWVYSIYLFYHGLGILKKTPENKKIVYMAVAFIVLIATIFIISAIVTLVITSFAGVILH